MACKEKTNRQIKVHKTQPRKLKISQHEPHQKTGVISGAPEGLPEPAQHVASVNCSYYYKPGK